MVKKRPQAPASLRVLGRFALASAAGAEWATNAPRQRALLAFLAMQPDLTANREKVAALLWGETDDHLARQNLRQIVSRLKRDLEALDPDILSTGREILRLGAEALRIDARRFESAAADPARAAEALDLYAGDFLEGFSCGVEGFDEWAEQERSRLRGAFRAAAERYLADPAADQARALAAAKRIVAFDPFDERAHRLLLQTLARRSGAEAALAQAERFARQLRSELGVDPDQETQALVARIRAQTASADLIVAPPFASATFFENVPPRDLNFTGRVAGLDALRAFLEEATQPMVVRQTAIHGLGGIGKTALAAEYAHRFAEDYAGVWWARAAQRTLLVESLASFAGKLNPQLAAEPDHEKAAVAGLALLSRFPKPFLLIYDNVESPETVQGLIPSIGARVIITSRWADWSGRAAELKLDVFSEDIAIEFLQKRAARLDPEGAQKLAAALGLLPLALDHAGAYCKLTGSGFGAYLERIDAHIARAPKGVSYPASVAATFGVAIESAVKRHPAAEMLLGSVAYLALGRVPLSLAVGADISEEERDARVAALHEVSLIEPVSADDGETILTVHPLVQVAMRNRLADKGEAAATLKRVVMRLAEAFPASAISDTTAWAVCGALLGHVLALREFPGWSADATQAASHLLHHAGAYLHARSAFKEAEPLLREALEIGEPVFASGDPALAEQRFDLARALFFMGRLDEAETLLRRSVADGETLLGREHVDVANRLWLLAELLSHSKRYAEAEPIFREIIAVADRDENGGRFVDVRWRNGFGLHLIDMGRFAEAESIYRQSLSLAEKKLSRDHPEFAITLNNFGRALRGMERFEEAEPLVREAIAIWSASRHPKDAHLARGRHNLAFIVLALGRAGEALDLVSHALSVHEEALGPAHFYTRDSAQTCARALDAVGREDEAAALRARFNIAVEPAAPDRPFQTLSRRRAAPSARRRAPPALPATISR